MERISDYLKRIIPCGPKCDGCPYKKPDFCDLSEEPTKDNLKICGFNE